MVQKLSSKLLFRWWILQIFYFTR